MTATPVAGPRPGTTTTAGQRAEDAIVVQDLAVTFPGARSRRRSSPVVVLEGVDLTVTRGELVAVIGPSGCGKSTLLRAIAGLLPEGARVSPGSRIRVQHVQRGRGLRPAVAWMPQQDSLLPWRRALPNALIGARAAGVGLRSARAEAEELFGAFGLGGRTRAWPHALSGGMRQRLALLRTVLTRQDILLLDEPFGALDAITRREMNAWLAGLRAQPADVGGTGLATKTIVLVTHDVDEALMLADRVVVMGTRPGRVLTTLRVGHASHGPVGERPELRDQLLTALAGQRSPAGRGSFTEQETPPPTARPV